jgi:hypothetical protein
LAKLRKSCLAPVFDVKNEPPSAPKLSIGFLLFGCPSFANRLEFLYGDASTLLCVVSAWNFGEL